jgi:hypothetical protein
MRDLVLVGAMAVHAPWLAEWCGPDRALRAAVATAIQAESGGRLDARGDYDAQAERYRSWGPFQMHDAGAGWGLTPEQRQAPAIAYARMVPEFRRWLHYWQAQGYQGRELVLRTALWTERPYGYDTPDSAAWQHYRAAYDAVVPADYWSGGTEGAAPVGLDAADEAAPCPAALAREREWGAAIQHDVIQRSREELEAALAGRGGQGGDWARVRRVVEWLRRHEQ